eukprot:g68842.t1
MLVQLEYSCQLNLLTMLKVISKRNFEKQHPSRARSRHRGPVLIAISEVERSRLFHNLIRTTQRPPGYVAHNISRDPGLVDCTVDLCVDKSSISTVDTNADTSE